MTSSLRFHPPLIDRASNPNGFEFNWKLLQYAFDIDDPAGFRSFSVPVSDDHRRAIGRYIQNAEILADSTVLNADGGMRVTVNRDGSEKIEFDTPSREAVTSWAVDFRRCYGTKEQAGFRKVSNLLWVHASADPDRDHDERLTQLARWRNAEASLHGRSLRQIAFDEYGRRQGWKDPAPNLDPDTSELTISEYLNGEYLHSDAADAAKVEARLSDEFENARYRFHFLSSTMGLAHIYIGFSLLARRAIDF